MFFLYRTHFERPPTVLYKFGSLFVELAGCRRDSSKAEFEEISDGGSVFACEDLTCDNL